MTRKEARALISQIHALLKKGYPPQGVSRRGHQGAIAELALNLGEPRQTIQSRLDFINRVYGIRPDWSLYRPKPAIPTRSSEKITEPMAEPRVVTRLQDELSEARRQLKEAHRESIGWEAIREGVLKLTATPIAPEFAAQPDRDQRGSRSVILHLSDLHCGEVVRLEDTDEINSFDIEIFKARIARFGQGAIALMTKHWQGDPPEKIIVVFGGDLCNGELHEDAAKTNDALSAPAVRICAAHLAGLLKELSAVAPVDVYSVPGNHGRLTRKIESKNFARDSLDTLVCSVVEMILSQDPALRVNFFAPSSGDALLKVYHIVFAIIHGQRELRGGLGFVGPFAAILRGYQKVHAYFSAQHKRIDLVLSGHLHTAGYIASLGVANGSLVGHNEFARDLRAKPEPASQNMIIVHSERGVISVMQIYVGHPQEGSIYG